MLENIDIYVPAWCGSYLLMQIEALVYGVGMFWASGTKKKLWGSSLKTLLHHFVDVALNFNGLYKSV